MLIHWHLFWLSSFIHLKIFEFAGRWRVTIDSDFNVVKLIYVHCSDEPRKYPLQWLYLISNKDLLCHLFYLATTHSSYFSIFWSFFLPYAFLSPSLDSVSFSPWFLLSSVLFSVLSSMMFFICIPFYFFIHHFEFFPSRYFVYLIAGSTPTIFFSLWFSFSPITYLSLSLCLIYIVVK